MKRVGLIVCAVVAAACLWAGSPASAAFSAPCSAAVTKLTNDALSVRAAYVTWANDLIARNSTKAATDKAAATTALNGFIADFHTLQTACASG
jgi:hypothetical protein